MNSSGFDTHNNNNNNSSFTYTFHGDPRATFAEFFGTSNPFESFFNMHGSGTNNIFGNNYVIEKGENTLLFPVYLYNI